MSSAPTSVIAVCTGSTASISSCMSSVWRARPGGGTGCGSARLQPFRPTRPATRVGSAPALPALTARNSFGTGCQVAKSRIEAAVRRAAEWAGLGRVTPHQLRHTLATQAINRGMSLEAIAALLGHRSLSMTRVYARIADRPVADEYFAVSEKVEALYDAPRHLPADAEGTEMAKLRREMDRRMLGNGYCARPVEMDCHFESICESCTFFVTTIEFRPTLERQRDDVTAKGQVACEQIFNGLLGRLDEQAS
ncbi:site-specific integrase [Streptomyces antibioticus]|uniref:site-specific integrase n=1 Tax=Streptomyces antibioticus TaxID=1890 RepID=UPI0033DB1A44